MGLSVKNDKRWGQFVIFLVALLKGVAVGVTVRNANEPKFRLNSETKRTLGTFEKLD